MFSLNLRLFRNHGIGNASPHQLLFGSDVNLPGEERGTEEAEELEARRLALRARARTIMDEAAAKRKARWDSNAWLEPLDVGDQVYLEHPKRAKLGNRYEGPFTIIDVGPNDTYLLSNRNNRLHRWVLELISHRRCHRR